MSIELVMLQYQLYISYIFSFSISYIGHYKCLHCLKKLKVKLPCDPAILLLGGYPKYLKTETQTDACVRMLIAVFPIAKTGKQKSVH